MPTWIDTDHGVYSALPARDSGAPDGATHAVFHECGTLVGYASATIAYRANGLVLRDGFATMEGAASLVADRLRCCGSGGHR